MAIRHVKCPYPSCNHSGEVLTNNHCETSHGMSRKDLLKQYGEAQRLRSDDTVAHKNVRESVKVTFNTTNPSSSKMAKQHRENKRTIVIQEPQRSVNFRK